MGDRVALPDLGSRRIITLAPEGEKVVPAIAFLIGPSGSNLRWIGRETGCKVRADQSGPAPFLEVTGPAEGRQRAARLCEELVRDTVGLVEQAEELHGQYTATKETADFVRWYAAATPAQRQAQRPTVVARIAGFYRASAGSGSSEEVEPGTKRVSGPDAA